MEWIEKDSLRVNSIPLDCKTIGLQENTVVRSRNGKNCFKSGNNSLSAREKIQIKKEAKFANRETKRRKRKKIIWKNEIYVRKREHNDGEINTRGRQKG